MAILFSSGPNNGSGDRWSQNTTKAQAAAVFLAFGFRCCLCAHQGMANIKCN